MEGKRQREIGCEGMDEVEAKHRRPRLPGGVAARTAFAHDGHLAPSVEANRRLIFLDGKAIVCSHNWIRDHAHQMKGWCHWERACLSFLRLIIDTQRAAGMSYELVKPLDDGHWTIVDDTSRVLFPEDNLALARLDLEADVEYVTGYESVGRHVDCRFALSAVGESRYIDVAATPRDGTADFEVLY